MNNSEIIKYILHKFYDCKFINIYVILTKKSKTLSFHKDNFCNTIIR